MCSLWINFVSDTWSGSEVPWIRLASRISPLEKGHFKPLCSSPLCSSPSHRPFSGDGSKLSSFSIVSGCFGSRQREPRPLLESNPKESPNFFRKPAAFFGQFISLDVFRQLLAFRPPRSSEQSPRTRVSSNSIHPRRWAEHPNYVPEPCTLLIEQWRPAKLWQGYYQRWSHGLCSCRPPSSSSFIREYLGNFESLFQNFGNLISSSRSCSKENSPFSHRVMNTSIERNSN